MDLSHLVAEFRNQVDPEARSQALAQIALAENASYDEGVVLSLIEALDDEDPVVREWATVALRKLKGNARALQAMWQCFRSEQRESLRCCAIVGLGRMGEHLGAAELRQFYQERRSRSDDLLLNFAIHWAGKAAHTPDLLQALSDIQDAEAQRIPGDPHFQTVTATAVFRCARHCLAAGSITKQWLRDRHRDDLLDKLGETRMQKLVDAYRAKLAQPPLLPDLGDGGPDSPLVPGRALADIQDEQHAQDLAEWKNVRIVETRSYVRDQHLAREAKKAVGYACQICGDQLAVPALSRRFVHAHHIEPLSEGGADVGKNLVVLCPNCHARVHAREIVLRIEGECTYASTGKSDSRPVLGTTAATDASAARKAATYAHVIRLLQDLGSGAT